MSGIAIIIIIIIIINEFHRDASLAKTSGPLCVTCFTSVNGNVAVWSTEQFRLQCTLECLQWRQWRNRRRQHVPDFCSGNGEGTMADGLVQRPWNMQRRVQCVWKANQQYCLGIYGLPTTNARTLLDMATSGQCQRWIGPFDPRYIQTPPAA